MTAQDSTDLDADFMRSAISLARRGLGNVFPNPAVGCLLVKDGLVVGRGWTQPGGRPHGETEALKQAGPKAIGATAYVTLEPCAHTGQTPPCAEALVKAGVARVVAAITDLDPRVSGLGLKILERGGISVTEGVCRDQAWQANLGFFLSQTEHRPMFTLKLATDALGNIPGPDAVGEDKWITSPQAQRRGHLLRANHDAVLFGIGTVLSDDPQYTCRLPGLEWTSPVRVLLDSRLRVPIDAKLLHSRDQAPIWIVCGCEAPDRADLEGPNVTLIRAPQPQPDAKWVAQQLAKRGLTRVLIEAGPQVVNSFLAAEVVDEVSWFRSARTLGAGAVPSFHENLWEKLALTRQAVLQAGPDQLELYTKEV